MYLCKLPKRKMGHLPVVHVAILVYGPVYGSVYICVTRTGRPRMAWKFFKYIGIKVIS